MKSKEFENYTILKNNNKTYLYIYVLQIKIILLFSNTNNVEKLTQTNKSLIDKSKTRSTLTQHKISFEHSIQIKAKVVITKHV